MVPEHDYCEGVLTTATHAIGSVVGAFPNLWKDTGNFVNVPEDQWMESHLLTIEEIFTRQVKHVFTLLVLEKKSSLMMLSTNCMSRVEWIGLPLPHPSPSRAFLSGKIVMSLLRTLRYDHAAHPTWSTQPPNGTSFSPR